MAQVSLALLSILCAMLACDWDVPPPAFLVSPTPTPLPPSPTVTLTPVNPFSNLNPQQEECIRKTLGELVYELIASNQRKPSMAEYYSLLSCLKPRRTPTPVLINPPGLPNVTKPTLFLERVQVSALEGG